MHLILPKCTLFFRNAPWNTKNAPELFPWVHFSIKIGVLSQPSVKDVNPFYLRDLPGAQRAIVSGSRLLTPFLRLHFQHNVCRLSSLVNPPFATGMIWSISRSRFGSFSRSLYSAGPAESAAFRSGLYAEHGRHLKSLLHLAQSLVGALLCRTSPDYAHLLLPGENKTEKDHMLASGDFNHSASVYFDQ